MELNQIKIRKDTTQKENSKVVRKIVKYFKDNVDQDDYEIFKNWGYSMGKSGRPDLEVVFNCNTWYIEAKDPNGKLSQIQDERIKKFKHIGITVYIIDHIDTFVQEVFPIMMRRTK
jgi:hypothetical protein